MATVVKKTVVKPVVKPVVKKAVTPVKPKSVIPLGYDKNNADAVTTAGNTAIDSAQKARDKVIKARLDEQVSLQAGQTRDAEKNLVDTTDQINQQTYDAQETQKAVGVQRGIQYSQQQQALEGGIAMQGTSLRVDAKTNRDGAIKTINEKIASLRNTASLETGASLDTANADKAILLEKQQTKYEGWTREDAVQLKAFNNQIKIMDIDQAHKVEINKLEFDQKKVMFSLEAKQQTYIANLNNTAEMSRVLKQIASSNMQNARDNATSRANTASSNATSRANNSANIRANAQNQANAIQAESTKQWKDIASTVMRADKNFNMSNPSDQKRFFTLIGMPASYQNQIIKQGSTPNAITTALSNLAKAKKTTVKALTTSGANKLKSASYGYGEYFR